MTRRPRTMRRPISAAEAAALAGIELDSWISAEQKRRPLDFEDDGRGTWTVKEHSGFKRQWRFVRSLPYIVQFIILQFALAWFTICLFVSWLVIGTLTMPR
jgi:hypothetical protein